MKEIFYDWGGANVWLFHTINNVRAGWLDGFMQLGSVLGKHTNFAVVLAAAALVAALQVTHAFARDAGRGRQQANLWLGVLAVFSLAYVIDGTLVSLLKDALDFPRPPAALPPGDLFVIGQPEYRHSLPSGHATFALTVTASLWPVLNRYVRGVAVAYVVWVGLSRVSLGAHFPADVLAGFALAIVVVALTRAGLQHARRRLVSIHRQA